MKDTLSKLLMGLSSTSSAFPPVKLVLLVQIQFVHLAIQLGITIFFKACAMMVALQDTSFKTIKHAVLVKLLVLLAHPGGYAHLALIHQPI